MSHNGGRVLKRKVTQRQRKHLLQMGPIHPDAEDALKILLGQAPIEAEEEGEMQAGLMALIDVVEDELQGLGEGENDPDNDDDDDDQV